MRFLVVPVLVAVFLAVCSAAFADSESEARAAFDEGKALFEQGKYTAAAAAFRRAYELKPNWKLLYNIGQSEAAAKRHGRALQSFEGYLSQGGDEVPMGRREEVLAEVARLRQMVGFVEIEAPDGAIVLVDDEERERTPLPGPLMIAAGVKHQVRIELGGEVLRDRPVRVSGGQTVKIDATAADEPDTYDSEPIAPETAEPQPTAPEQPPAQGNTLRSAGWVTLGLGAALLIGGGVTGGLALKQNDDLDGRCDGGCPPEFHEDNDRLKALAVTTDVLLGVGGAAAAAGIIMLIVSAGDESDKGGDVAVAPAGGPGFAGAAIQGRF